MDVPAEQVLQVVSFFSKPIIRHIGFCINSKEKFSNLRVEMTELKHVKEDVKLRLDAAKSRKQNCRQEVEGWVKKVDEIEQKVGDIEQDFQQREKCLGQCCPNCWVSYRVGKKTAKMRLVVEDMKRKGSFTSVVVDEARPVVDTVVEVPTTPAMGMEVMFKKFKELVQEKEVEIICIHGMGGVGKTTLLKKINNEFVQENEHFVHIVIWVAVPKGSREAILNEVQKDICERLGLNLSGKTEERTQRIYNYLKDKKFMLLLDDLWDRLDLNKVGIPHSSSNCVSKIAFTTRSTEVCGRMHAHKRIKVEPLQEKEAWELFESCAGTHVDVNSLIIQPHAKTIVGKCGGLPLALVTVGRAMANKKKINEWKDVVRALKQSPHELKGVEDEIFPVLKISYDNLRNETMKFCFLYCCLFPEGELISIEQLVEYYIGEGFFDELTNAEHARDKGHSVIEELKAACLLENDGDDDEERWVKLHDVMRHLAFWIVSEGGTKNKFLIHVGAEAPEVKDGKETEMIPESEKWQEAERILLMDTCIKELAEKPTCPNLLTLILCKNLSLVRLSNEFFDFMPALKVLDLSMTKIEELPKGIGKLLELKYLNLMNTKIRALPIELKCLVKLKYLNLSFTNLSSKPYKVITSFTKLQILNLYNCSRANLESSLEELKDLKFLSTLGINAYSTADIDKLMKPNKLLKWIKYFLISDCQELCSIRLPSLRGNDYSFHLRVLEIRRCQRLAEMTIDAGKEEEKVCLSSLEELTLEDLPILRVIWKETVRRGCFHHLRSIRIAGCDKLRSVTWVVHLENLRALHLSSCNGIEDIILSGEGVTQEEERLAFSKLREMELKTLPKLKSIYSHALPFPCLKDLYIFGCPKLKKLPLIAIGLKKNLQGIHGTRAWWNELEWEDDNMKKAFASYFREGKDGTYPDRTI